MFNASFHEPRTENSEFPPCEPSGGRPLQALPSSFCLTFSSVLTTFTITSLQDSRNALKFLRTTQDTSNCSNKELALLTGLCINAEHHTRAHTATLHSPGHCYLHTNMPGHARICRAYLGRRARLKSLEFLPSSSLTAYFQTAF